MHRNLTPAVVGALLSLSLAGHARAQGSDATAQVAPRGTSAVAGRVTSSGAPLAGAHIVGRERVSGVERSATSGADGRFMLADLPEGEYALSVRAIGYRERGLSVALTGGRTETVDVTLERTPVMLEATVTTATRTASSLSEIPGAVTVVDREAVRTQGATAAGLGEALAKTVPGLGGATGTQSTYAQPLRGRSISVLIDGVPLSTTRSVSRDLATIDPAAIERIEVLRGASAIYGDGGTGGVINIITRPPGDGPLRLTTDARTTTAMGAGAVGQGTSGRLAQTAAGRRRGFDFQVGGSLEQTGGFFDAEGDRIPPDPYGQGGLADTRTWSGFGKFGVRGGAQRLQLSLNHYDAEQNTRWATVPSRDTTGKARTRSGLELETPQGSLHTVGSLDYSHDEAPLPLPVLRGSRVHAQLFHRDFVTRFGPSLRMLKRPSTGTTTAQPYVYQSYLDTWKTGGRLEVTSRLLDGVRASVTWGGDASRERTFQGISIFDKPAYDSSQGLRFVKTDDWTWVPPMRTRSLAAFAQLEAHPISRVTVRGGVRHERDRVDVDDFTTIEEVSVAGGSLSFAPTVYNAGAVLAAGRGVELFANFSQGFSLGDIGLVLRQAPAGFVLGSKTTRAQEVDQYEAGMRGLWSRVQTTASVFRSTSELGSQVDGNLKVVRAPERIRGVETTLDIQPASLVDVGGTFTWSEGEFLDPKDSRWKSLNGFRISPAKATAYVAARPLSRLTTRFQMVHSGNRDAAFLDRISNGGRRVHEYTTFDLLGTLGVRSGGTLTVGVENLLNRQYFTTVSQLMTTNTDASRAAAPGRVLSVGYRVEY